MPAKDADGKVVHWFGTNTDISEQKKAEETLRESEERIASSSINLKPVGSRLRCRRRRGRLSA